MSGKDEELWGRQEEQKCFIVFRSNKTRNSASLESLQENLIRNETPNI